VGIGADGRGAGFQVSQRADFFEVEVGLETTLKRPIINTRDEPHADPEKYRRLHVIIGDANMSEVSCYLKLGTTALVLAMIEDRFITADLTVDAAVADLRAVSHDPSLRYLVTLRDGRKMTAVQLQCEYLELARKYAEDKYGADVDAVTADVLARWESVLERLGRDPMLLASELDWVAKLRLLEGYRSRDGLGWDHPKLALFDLQYSDVRRDRGLYNRLADSGRMVRLADEAAVGWAVDNPPEDTRAYFRGRCLRQYADAVAAASWDSVIFDVPGRESLQRVPTLEPLRGTRAHVGDLLDRCRTAGDLVNALTAQELSGLDWPAAGEISVERGEQAPERGRFPGQGGYRRWERRTPEASGRRRGAPRRPRRPTSARPRRSRSGTRSCPMTSTRSLTRSTRSLRRTLRSSSAPTCRRAVSNRPCPPSGSSR
jgi:proteasome accessory factor A